MIIVHDQADVGHSVSSIKAEYSSVQDAESKFTVTIVFVKTSRTQLK